MRRRWFAQGVGGAAGKTGRQVLTFASAASGNSKPSGQNSRPPIAGRPSSPQWRPRTTDEGAPSFFVGGSPLRKTDPLVLRKPDRADAHLWGRSISSRPLVSTIQTLPSRNHGSRLDFCLGPSRQEQAELAKFKTCPSSMTSSTVPHQFSQFSETEPGPNGANLSPSA
jgi:hypothetical protein